MAFTDHERIIMKHTSFGIETTDLRSRGSSRPPPTVGWAVETVQGEPLDPQDAGFSPYVRGRSAVTDGPGRGATGRARGNNMDMRTWHHMAHILHPKRLTEAQSNPSMPVVSDHLRFKATGGTGHRFSTAKVRDVTKQRVVEQLGHDEAPDRGLAVLSMWSSFEDAAGKLLQKVAESAQQLPSVALVYQTEGQTDGLTYGLGESAQAEDFLAYSVEEGYPTSPNTELLSMPPWPITPMTGFGPTGFAREIPPRLAAFRLFALRRHATMGPEAQAIFISEASDWTAAPNEYRLVCVNPESIDNHNCFVEAAAAKAQLCPELKEVLQLRRNVDSLQRCAQNDNKKCARFVALLNGANRKLCGNHWFQSGARYAIDENLHRRSASLSRASLLVNFDTEPRQVFTCRILQHHGHHEIHGFWPSGTAIGSTGLQLHPNDSRTQ
ncbi:Protein HID1 [Durusdinium trenchii]|uniref:Protein HID1 n=1 Tax=Durusdinium trenchii TaxID=1381693 RepID=A0ABP0RUT1_9DINO